ncbi:MAG: glycosyltransferase [Thermodesulfobacteriota bacterium]
MGEAPDNLERKRVALLGPTLPYRGGIAQYITTLNRIFASRTDLLTVSFKRQYPKLLYPGESDLDPDYTNHKEPGVLYEVDSLNPLTWLRVCRRLVSHRPEAVIISWWTVFWAPCFGFIARYLKRRSIKVIFICHNVVDHESAAWKIRLTRWVISNGSAFLIHCKNDGEKLNELVPGAKTVFHLYPGYDKFPEPKGTLPRRAKLELLFFGFVRPYKGLDILIDAMELLKGEEIFLTVAGEWWDGGDGLRARLNSLGGKAEVIDRFVTEDETAELFSRADVVVIPYRNSTGSGIVPLAYRYGKPVIATSVGGLPDVIDDGLSGFLVSPEDPEALAGAIRKFLGGERPDLSKGIKNAASRMTWEGLAKTLLSAV